MSVFAIPTTLSNDILTFHLNLEISFHFNSSQFEFDGMSDRTPQKKERLFFYLHQAFVN